MKITFVLPAAGKRPNGIYPRSWQMEPLQMAYLSSLTPPDIERVFFDDRLEQVDFDDPTDLAAISVETYTAKRAYEIAHAYRQRGVPVIVGGCHAALVPDEAAQHADAVLVGDAEPVWSQVLQDLKHRKLRTRYCADSKLPLAPLLPDRTLYRGRRYLPLALIETARGCSFGCEFCSVSAAHQRIHRLRAVTDVLRELDIERPRRVFFVDDNIAIDRRRALTLFRALRPYGLTWVGQASMHVASDPELLSAMQESGGIGLLMGFESLSSATLSAMNKTVNGSGTVQSPAEAYARAVSRLREHGLALYGTFIFGYDGDTAESMAETFAFAMESKLMLAAFNHLVPFPGTPLYRRLEQEQRLLYDKWWLQRASFGDVVFRPKNFTPEELSEQCYQLRRRYYSLRSIALRALDFQANCATPQAALRYFIYNLFNRQEVEVRQGLPFGTQAEMPGARAAAALAAEQ